MRKVYLLILIITAFVCSNSFGATLFESTFEDGTNGGWTVANGTQINKWFVGTATAYEGSRSMYISNNNGTSNAYSTTSMSITHIYRQVTLPSDATNITLSFYFKGIGAGAGNASMSVLRKSTEPTAGTLASGNDASSLGYYYNNSDWTYKTLNLSTSTFAGTTQYIVFSWASFTSEAVNPPAAVDNITLTYNGTSTETPPSGVATNPTPAHQATNVATTTGQVRFSTSGVTGATGYKLYFGKEDANNMTYQHSTSSTSSGVTYMDIPGAFLPLTNGMYYFWKIVPFNSAGDTTSEPVTWYFSVSAGGTPPGDTTNGSKERTDRFGCTGP